MNDKINNYISNMGALCETWIIIYNQFLSHGMEHKVALEHTQSFMKAFMESASNGNKGGDQ